MGSGDASERINSRPIWLDSLNCNGTEDTLFHCPTEHDCSPGERAGVICSKPEGMQMQSQPAYPIQVIP